jgi:glutathione S-transferase
MPQVSPVVPHTPGSWRLIYFDAPNRGEQVRQLFFLTDTPFVDVRVKPFPQGLDPYKKSAMGSASPLLGTDKCPAVTDPDGTHAVETTDIMRFVGQRVGAAPAAGSAEDAKAMDVCKAAQASMDGVFYRLLKAMVVQHILSTECFGALYCAIGLAGGKVDLTAPTAILQETMRVGEAALVASGGPYVCGAALSYADVSLFCILRECLAFRCFDRKALLAPFPKLSQLLDLLEGKVRPWIEKRVREHQLGVADTVEFFAATNTPFFWSRKTSPSE